MADKLALRVVIPYAVEQTSDGQQKDQLIVVVGDARQVLTLLNVSSL